MFSHSRMRERAQYPNSQPNHVHAVSQKNTNTRPLAAPCTDTPITSKHQSSLERSTPPGVTQHPTDWQPTPPNRLAGRFETTPARRMALGTPHHNATNNMVSYWSAVKADGRRRRWWNKGGLTDWSCMYACMHESRDGLWN